MMRHLNKRDLLCSNQYGFRPKSQTNHVVQKLLNFITDSSAENKVTVATYIDLSKAFDSLQYDKLFTKMRFLGFDTDTINWFKSHLSERKQVVDLEGTISSTVDMQLGVPQGSILGPILFLIYVNDINNCDSTATFTKFADDTTTVSYTHLTLPTTPYV